MQGYWQLPLHEDSQECQSIITPDGVYTPTRVQHGTTNATVHMQASITPDGVYTPTTVQHGTTNATVHMQAIMEDLMHDIKRKSS
jgi:hypothetical protein